MPYLYEKFLLSTANAVTIPVSQVVGAQQKLVPQSPISISSQHVLQQQAVAQNVNQVVCKSVTDFCHIRVYIAISIVLRKSLETNNKC